MCSATDGRPVPLAALLAVALSACSNSTKSTATDAQPMFCPIGDVHAPIEFTLVHIQLDFTAVATSSRAVIPILQAPQGFEEIRVGVRARNIDGCSASLTATLHERGTGRVASLEKRPVTLVAQPDGWGEAAYPLQPNNYSNLQTCPPAWMGLQVDGTEFLLRMVAEDASGRSAAVELPVITKCLTTSPDYDNCACDCSSTYVTGVGCVMPDAGPRTYPADAQ